MIVLTTGNTKKNLHPNVCQPAVPWSNEEVLHVAVAYSNQFRYRKRRELTNDFRLQIESNPNIRLYVGELAYEDRPFEITNTFNPFDYRYRSKTEMFHKENILNEVIRNFPPDWKYGAYVDADITFTRYDWALETIHQLQHYDWVQPFSEYANLSHNHRIMSSKISFAAAFARNEYKVPPMKGRGVCDSYGYGYGWFGATGLTWAFRRDAFEACGGLLDTCILGSSDWWMAYGLAGVQGGDLGGYHPNYVAFIKAWQSRAKDLNHNIGFTDGLAVHHFHGAYKDRGYATRDAMLKQFQFNPVEDIYRNYQGIYELTDKKPGLRDSIRDYFLARNEDATS